MAGKRKQRTWMIYAAAILVLALCTAAAWFLPGIYGKWQDRRQIGKVQLSSRDTIRFLDGDGLSQKMRWKMLSKCDAEDIFFELQPFYRSTDTAMVQACADEIGRWCDSGLLPFAKEDVRIDNFTMMMNSDMAVYAKEESFSVAVYIFSAGINEEILLRAVMDIETGKLYYVSACGYAVQTYMAKQLGYSSLEEFYGDRERLQTRLEQGESIEFPLSDAEQPDFTGIVDGIELQDGMDESGLRIGKLLRIDSCRLCAGRMIVKSEIGGYGLAVLYGPENYPELFAEVAERADMYPEWNAEPTDIYQWIAEGGRLPGESVQNSPAEEMPPF